MGYEEKGPRWVLGRGEDSHLGKDWDHRRKKVAGSCSCGESDYSVGEGSLLKPPKCEDSLGLKKGIELKIAQWQSCP